MNPLELIALHEQNFTKSDIKVKNFVIDNLDIITARSIDMIAEKADVSKSALLRFCKKLGYNGYSEFKYEVSKYLLSGTLYSNTKGVNPNKNIISYYVDCIQKLPNYISEEIYRRLGSFIHEAAKIRIYGLHESGLSAQYLSYRLATLGIDSEPLVFSGLFSEKASFSSPEDLNIFISVSGTTQEIIEASKVSLDKGAKTAMITQNSKSPYASQYDSFISIPSIGFTKNEFFLDSQAIFFITIDLLINQLSKLL